MSERDKHGEAIKRAWKRYLAAPARYGFGVREGFVAAFRDEWRKP